MSRKLHPSFFSICYDVYLPVLFRFINQVLSYVIKYIKSFLKGWWQLEIWFIDQILMRLKECCTQDGVIPFKNNASLMDKLRHQLISYLLVGSRRTQNICIVGSIFCFCLRIKFFYSFIVISIIFCLRFGLYFNWIKFTNVNL